MTDLCLHNFDREVNCTYDDEKYSVRDNGAVYRHPRAGKRPRPTDNDWIFGKPNSKNGYMYIADVRVHRIVATAFHGTPLTKEHVVDHIDTNRRNNRPENLRWLTRLENVLKNPITVKRIELLCGSVEAFLENPAILGDCKFDPNFGWMRTVSPEEAKACKERMDLWANSDKRPSGGSLGEWVYKPIKTQKRLLKSPTPCKLDTPTTLPHCHQPTYEERLMYYVEKMMALDLVISETLGAVQRRWSTTTEFPCCPQSAEENPIIAYAEKLTTGVVFARNHFSTSVVLESSVADNGQSILVLNETDSMKPWALAKVTYENGLYVHENCGSFFAKDGAEKEFCLARGLEWTGGDTFDDFC